MFIDSGLDHYQHLAEGTVEGVEVVILDPHQDGIEQITHVLQSRQNVEAVHILSHAAPGVLSLGNTQLSPSTLPSYCPSLQSWSSALSKTAEILLYGCRFAANTAGRSLVQHLARLTQATVAASDTLTGAASLGGDWNLAVRTAPMQAIPAFRTDVLQTYSAVMPEFNWSDPDIDWPDGSIGTVVFENVDGTDVDFTISVDPTDGVAFGSAGGVQTPDDTDFLEGGEDLPQESLHITMDNETLQDVVTTTVTVSRPVKNVRFQVYDIDEEFATQGWQDEVVIIGFFGDTVVFPTLTANPGATYTIQDNIATGVGNAPNTGPDSDTGTLNVLFNSPITSYQVIYRNGPDAATDPGEQGISILSNIFFRTGDRFPDTDDSRLRIAPGNTALVPGLGGSDPDGRVVRFRVTSIPDAAQGTLFLGNPDNGGTELSEGDRIRARQIDTVFFQASNSFTGDTFEYAAIDNDGNQDPTPGVVRLRPKNPDSGSSNQRPNTNDVDKRVQPDSVKRLRGLSGTDPDGTVEQFRIETLPAPRQGTLFFGNPNRNNATAVVRRQIIDATDISNLFFQSTANFSSTSFKYAAIDNEGARDRTPATVSLRSKGTPTNRPPETVPFIATVPPNAVVQLIEEPSGQSFEATDPDGDDTIETFTILKLPPKRFGELFIGDPGRRGTSVVKEEPIDIAQIDQIFFASAEAFNSELGATPFRIRYTATDDQGASDPTPARVLVAPEAGVPRPPCRPGETIKGTPRNDRLSGGPDADQIFGRDGNDSLRGRLCDDLVIGGNGNDLVLGQAGNDILDGGEGSDRLEGGSGRDLLKGRSGQDSLSGQDGNDNLRGGKDKDFLSGGAGDDILLGRSDDDEIAGDDGNDSIIGGRGDDRIQGGDGEDTIQGKSGNDRIQGNLGNDRIQGDRGDDTISARIGRDIVNGGLRNDIINGDAGRDRLRGENGDDRISGGAGRDRLCGNAGNDRLRGNQGNDIASGGRDNDFLSGRNGDDRLRGASGNDVARGNGGDDTLIGNRGQDRLNGRQDNDTIIGGKAEDVLTGGRGSDTFVYRTIRDGGETGDAIRRFSTREDFIDLSELFSKKQFANQRKFSRYVSLTQVGNGTQLDIDIAGEDGDKFRPFALLRGVNVDTIDRTNFIL
ncbi:MAG: DUF4347 domain-containing protein [Synechococcales cyanobacterium T60_A2020_003]|nr:DUF4347 domain-containing protein [Synechococcales cyanobacterium T60_A2020_003]